MTLPCPARSTRALLALAILTLVRLLVAAWTPLSPDEAYYWVWSRTLAAGYLDHPPMVALWIRAGTALVGDSVLGIRLLGPLSVALGSLLLADAAERLFPARRLGLAAAALLNATLLLGIGSVTMTPDTPLLFFWTAALWALARLHASGRAGWWLGFGAAAGLAMVSKYTAALLAPAVLAWLLLGPRRWLGRWQLWAGAGIAGLLFLPVIGWNAAHGWASFAKQGARAGDWQPARAAQFLAELAGSQAGLLTPGIAVLCAVGLGLAVRRARQDPAWMLLAALMVVPGLVFVQHALGDRVQGNWPAVLYPQAAIAAAAAAQQGWRRWLRPAVALGVGLTGLVWMQAVLAPLPLPARLDPTLLRLGGWPAFAQAIAATATREGAGYVAADNYGDAALLARLLPDTLPVLGVEDRWRLFALPDAHRVIDGRAGLLLRSARRDDRPDSRDWVSIAPLAPVVRARDGMPAETFRLYRVLGRAGDAPIVTLPRPR